MFHGLGNIPVVSVPATTNVASRPRKESIYDTEPVLAGAAHPAEVRLFNDFGQFGLAPVAPIALTKVRGRDTNLGGRNGLEKAQHFFWFAATHSIQVRNNDIAQTVANQTIYDAIRQIRELASWQFIFTDTPYITQPLSALPSSEGPQFLSTTHNAITVPSVLSWGVPHRSNDFSVQIMNRPVEITELETFSVLISLQQGAPTPVVNLFHQTHLRGIRLKGITG